MRIAILGNSGSGKSTLAAALAAAGGTPCLDLDTVAWEAGQVAVLRERLADALDVGRDVVEVERDAEVHVARGRHDPVFAEICRTVCVQIASRIESRAQLRDELIEFASNH